MKHKHAELIKAWADGAEIEYRYTAYEEWASINTPTWMEDFEYRIKPESVKVVRYLLIDNSFTLHCFVEKQKNSNLKLTLIDNVLVEAEVLKNGN